MEFESSSVKVYMTDFFYLLDGIFMSFSFKAVKDGKFHFRLCTKMRKVKNWG